MVDKFSGEEIYDLKLTFNYFDKNEDGKLSRDELGDVLRCLGKDLSESDIKKYNDTDFKEFLNLLAAPKDALFEQKVKAAFKVFDKDGLGYVGTKEMKSILSTIGEPLSEEDLKELIKEADPNGEGTINYSEFIKIMFSV